MAFLKEALTCFKLCNIFMILYNKHQISNFNYHIILINIKKFYKKILEIKIIKLYIKS